VSRRTVTCAEADGIECGFAVVVYYCRTYVKAVRGGGSEEGGRVPVLASPGMLRAAACVFGLWRCAFPPVSLGPAGDCPCKD